MNPFLYEWEAYYKDLASDQHVKMKEENESQVGKDLTEEDKALLNDSQKEQFQNLEEEAKHIFDKENKNQSFTLWQINCLYGHRTHEFECTINKNEIDAKSF